MEEAAMGGIFMQPVGTVFQIDVSGCTPKLWFQQEVRSQLLNSERKNAEIRIETYKPVLLTLICHSENNEQRFLIQYSLNI